MVTRGGPAALRGYRLQSLYALWRILEDDDPEGWFRYRLEGTEDVEVQDGRSGAVTEFVQVKAYSGALALSHLDPTDPGKANSSVLRRVLERLGTGRGKIQKVVSIGLIGPELKAAWNSEGAERDSIRKKLGMRYSPTEIESLLASVSFDEHKEKELVGNVLARLKDGMAGGDPETAFELLSFWIHLRSEEEALVSREDVRARIGAVGKFLADRAAHHREWFTSILPLAAGETASVPPGDLRTEFYLGVSARFDHVLADVDVVRTNRLEEIASAFVSSRVVVVHGPSGQGKSALAYRFLHDFVPGSLRFEVRSIEDLRHAQSISQALVGHARSIAVPMYVYVDVLPRDRSWMEVVDRLSRHSAIRVLVTVREEDWAQAGTLRYQLSYGDVALTFDRQEAEALYVRLVEGGVPDRILDFDDAWRRFGPPGPLLEFVFLVVQDATLRARLEEQVRTLERDLDPSELEFLRLASVATAYGADLNLKDAVESAGLSTPAQTLRRLEREYLLRSSSGGHCIEALHPIRSEFLAQLLTDTAFQPRDDVARRALPLVADPGLEVFALHLLSRHWATAEDSVAELMRLRPDSWTGVGGVLRVLLWCGIRKQLEESKSTLEIAFREFGRATTIVLNWDVAGLMELYPDLQVRPEEWGVFPEELQEKVARYRTAACAGQLEFALAKKWLLLDHQPSPCSAPSDWSGVSCSAFWAGHWGWDTATCSWILLLDLGSSFEGLAVEDGADVLFALSFVKDEAVNKLVASARRKLTQRFREQMKVVWVEVTADSVRAHFIIEPDSLGEASAKLGDNSTGLGLDLHAEALSRLDLLRRLYPAYKQYGCQGYGHTLVGLGLPYDPTYKEGVAAQYLLPPWPLSLNCTYRHLVEYERRPQDWKAYADIILDMREENLGRLEDMRRVVGMHFGSSHALGLLNELDTDAWDLFRTTLGCPPRLPQVAVDEWGFVGEGDSTRSSRSDASQVEEPLAVWQHREYLGALDDLVSALRNFYDQAILVLAANPMIGRASSNKEKRAVFATFDAKSIAANCRLSSHNLLDALISIEKFQAEFRSHLGAHFPATELAQLEAREQAELLDSWTLWCQFAFLPSTLNSSSGQNATSLFDQAGKSKLKRLEHRLVKLKRKKHISAQVLSEGDAWDDEPALWVSFDVADPLDVQAAALSVMDELEHCLRPGNSQLHRAMLRLRWRMIVIVPCVRGRTIDRSAICIPSIYLTTGAKLSECSWWTLVPRPIPEYLFNCLELTSWQDSPHAEPRERLYTRTIELFCRLGHLQFVDDLPDADDEGNAILREVVSGYGSALSDGLNRINSALKAVSDPFQALSDEEQLRRPHMSEALARLELAWTGMLPQADMSKGVTLSQDGVAAWFERFSDVMDQIVAVRLLLLADLIENEARQSGEIEG